MLLSRLQQCLQTIYDLDIEHDVTRFVSSDRDLVAQLDSSAHARDIPEKLLLRQDGDTVDVTLYLDTGLLACLSGDDPWDYLHAGNLAAYLAALEGISHFIYFAWNCRHDRPVSLLEMELQAEVDKYITSLFLLTNQRTGYGDLHHSLFTAVSYDPRLSAEECRRYRLANDYAAWYCAWLCRNYIDRGRHHALTQEIRRFYRLPHTRKTSYIDSL